VASASGLCPAASAQIVALGTDYLTTAAGSQFNVPGYGVIQFKGVPLPNMGTTDTVVERQEDADLTPGSATRPIQVTKLSLESTAPVTINGLSCDVFATLNKADLAKDVGTMTIVAGPPFTSGTFDSIFTLYYELTFTTSAGQTCRAPIRGNCQFGQNGAPWSSAAARFAYLVTGPDNCTPTSPPTTGHCLDTKDQNANTHTGKPPGTVDFYAAGSALHMTGGGQHVVVAACKSGGVCSKTQPEARPN
jgi:hypothetical protein